MKAFFLSVAILGFIACKKKRTTADVENNLSNAMLTYLWNTHNKDTSNIKFQVLSVYYYEDKLFYECDFNVRMHVLATGYDTSGVMKARVSKDYTIVKRKL